MTWGRNQKIHFHVVVAVAVAFSSALAAPSDINVVSSCPQKQRIPVEIKVDCSRLEGSTARTLCGAFAVNQACKVVPAYRKITGIDLERLCASITYTLYNDRTKWPYSTAGGISFRCRIDQLVDYAFQSSTNTVIGPHEVHEMLHQYQMAHKALNTLTASHPLFASSMLEAEREVGEIGIYESGLKRLKRETQYMRTSLDKGAINAANMCKIAQAVIEEELYLQNTNNIYKLYRAFGDGGGGNPTEQMSAILNALSGGAIKPFLLARGCDSF